MLYYYYHYYSLVSLCNMHSQIAPSLKGVQNLQGLGLCSSIFILFKKTYLKFLFFFLVMQSFWYLVVSYWLFFFFLSRMDDRFTKSSWQHPHESRPFPTIQIAWTSVHRLVFGLNSLILWPISWVLELEAIQSLRCTNVMATYVIPKVKAHQSSDSLLVVGTPSPSLSAAMTSDLSR